MTVYGLILAGGTGSRLGHVRKAELRIGGERLVDRISGVMAASTDALYVATGIAEQPHLRLAASVPDLGPNEGPMGGLRAFLHHIEPSEDSIVVTTSVDSPFLPAHYVDAMRAPLAAQGLAVVSVWQGQRYPTHAAWRVSALKQVAGQSSPKRALESLNASELDWSAEKANPFANINDFSDLLAAQRRSLGWGKDK
ncbi:MULTISPECIES: molybdenum cofactor guanylyltransferase [unclassified Devosia]|uniref:molybdenum cofactor guanylyltransferase n=1 Tax=unclassified Devosia TaxID=196773 RepID=UPI0015F94D5C|nr:MULTISPECIES: molybdenum cofactor guanylyltransferase [unclassified Devosia]MBJ6986982.1 molybdenum cofactor guanylyltransferase [Devosia sp. MC521]MBK1795753.1 molybdenum cofactor guanylyltransferase [Devosia sp. WQ 349K1]QMW64004.1 molybdenum cofactor guanylyltransferase [Devosia sp. MC521]